MASQPPPRSGPNLYVPNPERESPTSRSNLKAIVITAAVTALVGVATVGGASWVWNKATRRASKALRRQEAAQDLVTQQQAQYAAYAPVAYAATPWPGSNPQPGQRYAVPDALAYTPTLIQPPQPMPIQVPIQVAPGPDVTGEIRRLGAHIDKRFAHVEHRIDALDNPDDEDDDDDQDGDDEDDDNEEPRRRRA